MRSRILLLASTWGALAAVSASAQTLADPSATSAPASTIAASPAGVTPTPASTQAATGSVGGDIIVTARKRQESILNVPVIETAIPQARLDKLQVTDLAGVQTLVPGLSLGTAVITIGTQVSLRGIGTTALDAGIDQSVSLNLDGLQLSQGLAYSSGVFDLAQIEVLKGPQALFYGKNSPGGVISLRTADPGDRFEVIARYGHEFYANEHRGELILSGPVTPTLGIRLAGLYDSSDGFFKNEAVALPGTGGKNPRYGTGFPTKSYVVRGTAVWKPSPAFDARLKVNFTRDKIEGGPEQQYVSCPEGVGAVPGFGIPFLGGGEDCKLDRVYRIVDMDPAAFPGIRNGGTPFTDIRQHFGTLELNYRPAPGITATSTTGYYHVVTDGLINGSESTYAGTTLAADNHFRRHDVTEEVRVNSDFQSAVNFTVGGFYQNASVFNNILVEGNTVYGLPAILVAGTHDIEIDSKSVFGQLRWKVVPKVELSGGLRYTHEVRTDSPTSRNPVSGIYTPTAIPNPRLRSNNVSPEATITYKPIDDLTLFASYKRGFKSGSFSITTPANAGVDNSFGDEKIKGFEGGIKARLFDRQLVANLAGYRYKLRGLQVGSNEAVNGIPVLHTVNAGSALIYGIDFDADYRPVQIPALDLHVGGEWNHARFGTLDNASCYGGQTIAMGCSNALVNGFFTAQDLNGAPLVRAPLWQLNFGFSYSMPVGEKLKLTFDSNNQYSSRYLAQLGNRPDFYQSAFLKTDATVTLTGPSDRWELALIGRNLSNKITTGLCTNLNGANGSILGGQITGSTGVGPAGIDENACAADRGREVWLRLTLRPFG